MFRKIKNTAKTIWHRKSDLALYALIIMAIYTAVFINIVKKSNQEGGVNDKLGENNFKEVV